MNETVLKIRKLNDEFRKNLISKTGIIYWKLILTKWVLWFSEYQQIKIIKKAIAFNKFTEDNDPYGEHDFWTIEIYWTKFFWKIDYYDKNCEYGSLDPSDEKKTTRVMTILLAEER